MAGFVGGYMETSRQTRIADELQFRGYTGAAQRVFPVGRGPSALERIRRLRWASRLVLALTLSSFLAVDTTWAKTRGENAAQSLPKAAVEQQGPRSYGEALARMKEVVRRDRARVAEAVESRSGIVDQVLNTFGASKLGTVNTDDLYRGAEALQGWDKAQRKEFALTEARLKKMGVSGKILARHAAAVAQYNDGYRQLRGKLTKLQKAQSLLDQDKAMAALAEDLEARQFGRSQEPFDPNDPLPFGPAPRPEPREPSLTLDPVSALMSPTERVADAVVTALGTVGDALITPAVADGDPNLAPTTEVVIDAGIQAKAAELNHNPVAIYNWVRNHVAWIPTYGAIQTADMTLATQRGNAFDIASLLIALLRASNIPARYAYGVIEVPADKAQNWVGGVYTPGAAQEVLGQGGIPNAGLTAGGKVVSIRMEHVWVEAFVDFVPSRAAKHVAGDSWVPLDASYKQYDYTSGYDLATQVPFDAQALLNDLQASATVNEAEGWVQNIDQALIEQRFEQYRAQVESYINNQDPEATVGEVLGTRNTIVFAPMELAAGLPYRVEATTARYAEIPNALRHQYTLSLAERTALAQASGETVFSVTMPLSRAANHAVALSFVPATEQDEELLVSMMAVGEDENGDPVLPTELPGYLINMRAQLTLDGEVIAEGGSFALGTELEIAHRFTDPRRSIPVVRSIVVAGEYHAIGVDSGQINPQLLTKTKTQLEQAKTELEAIQGQLDNNQTPTISDFLTKHTLTGNLLQTGILGYFAINDALDQLDARSLGVVTHRMPSFGTFATSLQPEYVYGVPRNVKLAGLSMDVDRIFTLAASKADKAEDAVVFFRTTGPRKSAFEHLVPEQLFSTEEQPAEAISAVKALAIAASQGQKIYTITQANAAQVNELTISAAVKQEITEAINAGKEVTVHQNPITHAGWTGEGYIVIDPETGAGGYKISGGGNGSAAVGQALLGSSEILLTTAGGMRSLSETVRSKARILRYFPYLNAAIAISAVFSILLDDKANKAERALGEVISMLAGAVISMAMMAVFPIYMAAAIAFISIVAVEIWKARLTGQYGA